MNNGTEQIFLVNFAVNQPVIGANKANELSSTSQVNLEDVEDFSNVCRTCATITEFVIPIFMGEGLQNNLADKIQKHLPIEVTEHDLLPRVVCYQCASTLLAWHELVQCCVQADKALKTRLSGILSKDIDTNSEEKSLDSDTKGKWTQDCESYRMDDGTETVYDTSPAADANEDVEEGSCDDEPLASLAAKKSKELYKNFYRALVNFGNHYVSEHGPDKSDCPVFTDSSDSEEMGEQTRDGMSNADVEDYDDLSSKNMRKDHMDEGTRMELNTAQRRIDGKVYYVCSICDKRLSSPHTYIFHKRIHTGERPCVCHVCGKQFRAPHGLQRHLTETHERVKRHPCGFCKKTFANTQNLKQHIRIHTGERPYVCPHCGKRFTQSGSLHVHLRTHSEQFPFQCVECGAKFRLRLSLTRHRLKHTGEKPHTCLQCGKDFRQRRDLYSHMMCHGETKPHTCVICNAAFKQSRALKHHCKRVHQSDTASEANTLVFDVSQYQFDPTFTPPPPPRYTDAKRLKKRCQYCHVEVPAAGYTDHLIGSHSELLFHCSQCNMYLDRKEFALHASAHHVHASDGDKEANRRTKRTRRRKNSRDRNDNAVSAGKSKASLSAQIIERTIRRASRNSTTADIATEENEFSDHSDVEYFGRLPESVFQAIEDSESATVDPSSSNVPEDTSDHNEELAPIVKDTEALPAVTSKKHKRPRKCPVCSKVYTASSSYFYHLNSHRQNDFVCSVCGKKLGNKASLLQHASIHSNERRFECVECGKKFRSRASLYIHSESHRETKNFACDQCDSSFRWRTHLLRHLKRHSAEKTQVCTTCGRGFSVRADLLRHLRTHRAGSHACEKCNAKFAQRRYLKVHMMKKHSIAISGREITQQ